MSDLVPADTLATSPHAPAGDSERDPGTTSRRRPGSPSLVVGLVLVSLTVALGLLSIVWIPYPLQSVGHGARLADPSAEFWLGTDRLGRDLLSQFMAGARSALIVGAASVAIAAVIGVAIGVLAATTTRWIDQSLSVLVDLLIAFPTLLLAMLIVTVRGPSLSSAIIAIGISGSAVISRVTRVNVARVLREDFIAAAVTSGTGWSGIVVRHLLPNIVPTLLVQLMLLAGSAILAEASLSYLGLGPAPPAPSWGRMLLEAQSVVLVQPWAAVAPGLGIAWTVLGLNLVGDGLRETFDPTLKRAR